MAATHELVQMALRDAVRAGTLAPSVHNTQPWHFVLGESTLQLRMDRHRQLAVIDASGRELHLSVGCALFNVRVSLAAAQLGVQITRLPERDRAARIEVRSDIEVESELAGLDEAISRRQTNRRPFSDEPVPGRIVDMLIASAAAEDATLYQLDAQSDRLIAASLTREADSIQGANPAYRAELRAWTAHDPARPEGVRPLTVPQAGASADEMPIRDFDSQGTGWLPTETGSSANPCLLLLGTDRDDPLAWLRAGEALERVWLELTRAGYVASLFTQPTEVSDIRQELRAQLGLDIYPHLLMRVGKAEMTPSSRRRPLSEVLDES